MRSNVVDIVRSLFRFGRIASSATGASKSVVCKVDGAEGEGSADDNELWSHAPLLYKPAPPDLADAVTGTAHCESLFFQLGDEKVILATKDRRWQIEVANGEVVLRAMGEGAPAYVHLKPDGTAIIKSSAVRIGDAAGVQPVVLGTFLKACLDALTVPTAMGPSGTPINAATFSTFLSANHKVDV